MGSLLGWALLPAAALHIIDEFVWLGGFARWYRTWRPGLAPSMTPAFFILINTQSANPSSSSATEQTPESAVASSPASSREQPEPQPPNAALQLAAASASISPASVQSTTMDQVVDRAIERVGSNKAIPIDVRVIAATHRDLNMSSLSMSRRYANVHLTFHCWWSNFIDRFSKKAGKKFKRSTRRVLDYYTHTTGLGIFENYKCN